MYIATFSIEGELYKSYKELGVEMHLFPKKGLKKIYAMYRFYKFIKKNRIDCIHINLVGTFLFAVPIAKLANVKNVIVHWHSVYYIDVFTRNLKAFYVNVSHFFAIKLAGIWANSVIAISNKVKDYNCKRYSINRNKVRVIYNAIDFSNIPTEKEQDISKSNTIKIGTIGKITKRKGILTLINAFNEVIKQHSNCKLELVGEFNAIGHEEFCDSILNLCNRFNLDQKIEFKGMLPYDKVFQSLFSWEVFVLASEYEGFGLVVVEAMATGTPVVASRVDAIPEIIDDQKSGLLFKSGDHEDLANKIIQLINSESLRSELAHNASASLPRFGIQRMISELDDEYSRFTKQ